jgi:hypothetical protein
MQTYRLLEDGEEVWRGRAESVDDALDKAFTSEDVDECFLAVEGWQKQLIAREMKAYGWVRLWSGRLISDY